MPLKGLAAWVRVHLVELMPIYHPVLAGVAVEFQGGDDADHKRLYGRHRWGGFMAPMSDTWRRSAAGVVQPTPAACRVHPTAGLVHDAICDNGG